MISWKDFMPVPEAGEPEYTGEKRNIEAEIAAFNRLVAKKLEGIDFWVLGAFMEPLESFGSEEIDDEGKAKIGGLFLDTHELSRVLKSRSHFGIIRIES